MVARRGSRLLQAVQTHAAHLPPPTVLAPLAVEELEQDYMGDRLKTQKLLREKFEDVFRRGLLEA